MDYISERLLLNSKNRFNFFINCASSIDGFIARPNQRTEISGREDWEVVMNMRNTIVAILVGSNTIHIDNPRLLTKAQYLDGDVHHPIRIVLDRSGRLNLEYEIFKATESTIYWITSKIVEVPNHVKILQCKKTSDIIEISNIIEKELSKHNDTGHIMIEGGSRIIQSYLESGLVKRIRIYRSPQFFGKGTAILTEKTDIKVKLLSLKPLGEGIEEIWGL